MNVHGLPIVKFSVKPKSKQRFEETHSPERPGDLGSWRKARPGPSRELRAAGNSLGQGYARLNGAEQQKQEIMQDAISRGINDATLRDQYTCDVSQDNDHLRSLGFDGVDPPDGDF